MENHPFKPVFNSNSRVLILGSFPSVKSRAEGFYYGHPRNRFWTVLAAVLDCSVPVTIEDKKALLLENKIALWDVCASCEVEGSSDASIRRVEPNDIGMLLSSAKIERIFTNGGTADRLYRKLILPTNGIEPTRLPSTSPANAAASLLFLTQQWKKILL